MDYKSWLPDLIETGHKAGEIVMDFYRNKSFEVEIKEDNTPVTTADKEASRFIVESLLKIDPTIPVISEEEMYETYDVRRNYEYFWCVDPIDGTREFIKGNGEFTINIALINKNRPVMGLICAPDKGENYYAMEGMGAWKYSEGGERKKRLPLVSGENITMIVSRSALKDKELQTKVRLEEKGYNVDLEYCGSTLKQCKIAEGKADVYPKYGRTKEWDTAAADIIVKESGGRVMYFPELQEGVYNKSSLVNPHFIALCAKHSGNSQIERIISSL